MKRGIGLAVLLVLGLGWFQVAAGAPDATSGANGSGFAVSPAFGEVEVPADKPEVPYAVKVSNSNAVDQKFALSVVDFGSLDEEGGVAFLGQPASELEHKYGLASWVRLEHDTVTVPAGKTITVNATIVNRASLAPGGHYGAVLATAVTDTGAPAVNSVGIKQVVSSLILVTKDGGVVRDLAQVEQTSDAAFWHLPGWVQQRFASRGNVHVIPRGVVEVRDGVGRVVERAAINEASGAVLPESFRKYKTDLLQVAPAWMPGRYRIVSTYRYDGSDATHTYVTTFWYVGALVVWLVGLLAMAAIGTLAWWLFWRRPRKAKTLTTKP